MVTATPLDEDLQSETDDGPETEPLAVLIKLLYNELFPYQK